MMYAINYDGDWVKGVTGRSIDYDELTSDDLTTNIDEAILFKEHQLSSAESLIERLVMISGYNHDAFEIVPVKIVRADANG